MGADEHAAGTEETELADPQDHRQMLALRGRAAERECRSRQRSQAFRRRRLACLVDQCADLFVVRSDVNLVHALVRLAEREIPLTRALTCLVEKLPCKCDTSRARSTPSAADCNCA